MISKSFTPMFSTQLPLSERYQRFREDVLGESGMAEPDLSPAFAEPTTELQLQSLWFGGEFGIEFSTVDHRAVRVLDFGVWNSGPGPDFQHCVIEIDGQRLQGDIELDRDVRDWERHGHSSNETFEHVVLHLFLDAPVHETAFTRTLSHRLVPQVRLDPSMRVPRDPLARPLAPARLGRCSVPLAAMGEAAVESLLQAAAQFRMERKSLRLGATQAAQGSEQALYQGLATVLGYRPNAAAFALLAQRLPVARAVSMHPEPREALLYGIAGFTEDIPYDEAADDTKSYLRELWEHWWKLRSAHVRWLGGTHRPRWKVSGARPGNHPQRRLAALVAMLREWSSLSQPILEPASWDRDLWVDRVMALKHPYWDTHYTLLAKPAHRPIALVGEARTVEMLANVVYPMLMPENPRLWAEYLGLAAMQDNQKLQRARLRLFGPGSSHDRQFSKRVHHQQGLLQVYEDFCLEDDSACVDCPFPERLAQWQA
jgi:Protein of unknown function (DUF2851)